MTVQSLVVSIIKSIYKRGLVQDEFDGQYPFDLNHLPSGRLKTFGCLNPEKIFYVIWKQGLGAGFFSNFSHVLGHLRIAHELDLIPVVDFQSFKTFFNEMEPMQGSRNAWEYYFKPVSPVSLDEVYRSRHVIFCSGEHPVDAIYIGQNNALFAEVFARHIVMKSHVLEAVARYDSFFRHEVLGVHYRGTDLNIAPEHPFGPTGKQILRYAHEVLDKHRISKIFLATEDQAYLDLFLREFGTDNVCFTDSFRSYGKNVYNLAPRANHRYRLGLDVLTDASLLAKCAGLLCSQSNVSEYSQLANRGRYKFMYKIVNGFNYKCGPLARYSYGIKQHLPPRWGGLIDRLETVI